MRESNFAFPAQNRACVCISSQLYDRRALDTESPLPLFNSLTHLVYLTSTSPRIREIMTMDGGLERLVRILHDFCICPPPPENPQLIYGLAPPAAHPPKLPPTLNPAQWDKHAAYRFSLAFQCLVNIGVRGSEHIRSRVVQAGTLDVVGMILEAWLVSKGFAVGPSSSATGLPRESREQRAARRAAALESRQRDQAQELTRALQRQAQLEHVIRAERAATGEVFGSEQDVHMADTGAPERRDSAAIVIPSDSTFTRTQRSEPSSATSDAETSTDNSTATTPVGSGTPTGAVVIPVRERSGTIIARPAWDPAGEVLRGRNRRQGGDASASNSTDNSRPETETEDDGDVDMDTSVAQDSETSPSPRPRAPQMRNFTTPRRAVGIVSDAPPTNPAGPSMEMNTEPHIVINDVPGPMDAGVEDGIVSLEPNDDFAMGAPPGAPGAIEDAPTVRPADLGGDRTLPAPDVTPRAGTTTLPGAMPPFNTPTPAGGRTPGAEGRTRNVGPSRTPGLRIAAQNEGAAAAPAAATANATTANNHHHHHHHHHHHARENVETGPYRDEDVLLSLQLLAYLSKYPHVRQAFYKPRTSFHPATAALRSQSQATTSAAATPSSSSTSTNGAGPSTLGSRALNTNNTPSSKESYGFFKSLGRGKEKEKEKAVDATPAPAPVRHTNVFSLVERFTFRPSSSEADMPNAPPPLPHEIQYWAGAIMRNACRKDDSRGGIRQCANMLCGKWESYPREFAKCRRCRKAKYCGKECQSTAWSEGHRFWCSAKDGDEDAENPEHSRGSSTLAGDVTTSGGTVTGRAERRAERERERQARLGIDTTQVTRAVHNAFRSTATTHTAPNPNAADDPAAPNAQDPVHVPTPEHTPHVRPPWNVNYDLTRRLRPRAPNPPPPDQIVDSPVFMRRRAETVGTIGDGVRLQPPPLPPRHLAVGSPSPVRDEEVEDAAMMEDTTAIVSVDDDMVLG
ncbi:hypothetical protein GLOTRDRAFT_141598 [Gloeophyllum trabeum ATCC 11539]|uniref:MYND-type domain-containing protein n=1 Tax=Gloeophyllum trabeum (strain ATCC 11539 / FP-39264 / Madison 617) TaxID=670483 RepID=S7PS84_GLOTA|nr:uncharacterized protein GLOTRDRAFT_141598 [Gloeophyllum trabeum ATCC 11539]EPQ50242.1 hypothetical protein GLOTRDRAFT_141598 [Gloeophyllum trabeum ATCC 11539]